MRKQSTFFVLFEQDIAPNGLLAAIGKKYKTLSHRFAETFEERGFEQEMAL